MGKTGSFSEGPLPQEDAGTQGLPIEGGITGRTKQMRA